MIDPEFYAWGILPEVYLVPLLLGLVKVFFTRNFCWSPDAYFEPYTFASANFWEHLLGGSLCAANNLQIQFIGFGPGKYCVLLAFGYKYICTMMSGESVRRKSDFLFDGLKIITSIYLLSGKSLLLPDSSRKTVELAIWILFTEVLASKEARAERNNFTTLETTYSGGLLWVLMLVIFDRLYVHCGLFG
ncbi:hypothetical protein PHYBLDRAFT_171031 [Phycomyces blakesleeanus NRRL 1555(-)]|uniref:Uncharacterized protein n=1 Tax=Phycomyces blakesleeanus (strain ATCC 8743b / DSM 1359 / FGSC 10004 / NBRC 33097 / NRRL 1555) TaxID=763407 RepID=A0A163DFW2_PHYB8|nr:hypothetical protein PHYBLDRAFT_171031 [Phycomyces blakesleeanus NRRL 1555(-)]OAD70960.1 hypothetical protein PHYBLDRAFT_171031 [Phycomyces blakesleeanus NRRL 1555(-)]|eukprot:XP_018289000.1 hypothetical protein PHYBLDRAFT_171031 [Phycomyces blakesleeanus NRRL 1555(-)]